MTFKNTKTKKSTTKKYRCVVKAANKPVEEKTAKITAIKQEKASTLTATFSADVTGVSYGAISVVRDETKAVVTVKSITVDKKDNTKAAIETYETLTDGKAYTVTYKAADGTESSATFTATDGTVADIALNTYTIPANTPTEIKYQTLDANGVIIEEKGIGSSKSNYMDITVENANGYQNNNELLLYKTGDTASIKAVYHTFKYNNTNGTEEGKVEKTFTITAVDQSTVIEVFDYTVTDKNDRNAVDFKHDKLTTQIAMDDDKNTGSYAQFSFRTAADKDITKSLDYTVSSGNENVLLASGTVAEGAQLTPVGIGATYLVIKNASGTVVTTLPITVVAKRSLSTMTVDKSSVTVSEQASAAGSQKITVAVMDQYSAPYTNFDVAQPELKSSNNPGSLSVTASARSNNKTTITVDSSSGATVGSYIYTMDLTDTNNANNVKKVSFTVIVSKKLTNNESYALVMMNGTDTVSKVDTTVTADDFSDIVLTPTVVAKNNGSITGEADVVSISALKLTKNGAAVDNTDNRIFNKDATQTSESAIKVATGTNPIVKWLEPGTYTVSFIARINMGTRGTNNQNMSTSFVVEDSQKEFKASVKKEAVDSSITKLDGVFNNTDYVTFTYAGHELEQGTYTYASAKYTQVNNGKSLRVTKVTMNVLVPGTNGKTVQMTADVNRTFTFGSGVTTVEMEQARAEAASNAAVDIAGAVEDIKTVSGTALSTTFPGVVSGSVVNITATASEVSVGAISAASIVKVTATGAKDNNKLTVTLDGVANDALTNGDKFKVEYVVTVSNTVGGQTVTSDSQTVTVTYTWDGSKWGAVAS